MKKTVIDWIFHMLLILLSAVISLGVVEAGIRVFKGSPPALEQDSRKQWDFYWGYVDIYDRFFVSDGKKGLYTCARPHVSTARDFPVRKAADEKRVFIIGESFAQLSSCRENEFIAKLKEVDPAVNWRVINCGVAGYDSYRIRRVAEEIVNYEPDLVVLMMGNNSPFRPVTVNHWKYKYALVRHSWILRVLSEYINGPREIPPGRRAAYDEKNLAAIVADVTRRGIPLAIVTLPRNTRIVQYPGLFEGNQNAFREWWFLQFDPSKIVQGASSDTIKLAVARERLHNRQEARRLFLQHSAEVFSGGRYKETRVRNDAARGHARKNARIILVDFEKTIMDAAGRCPGFEIFEDSMHVWPEVYNSLFDEIVERVYGGKQRRGGIDALKVKEEMPGVLTQMIVDPAYLAPDLMGHAQLIAYADRHNPGALDIRRFAGLLSSADAGSYFNVLALGEAFRQEGKLWEASSCLSAAVRLNAGEHEGYFLRGICRYQLRDRKGCREDLDRLHALKPEFFWLTPEFLDSLDHAAPVLSKL